jgi:hypothetical protein
VKSGPGPTARKASDKKPPGRKDDRRGDRKGPPRGSAGGGGRKSDIDLGIDLWPDTPNLHGGLNRKTI